MRRKMTTLVRRWEQSTETRETFARRHGLTLASFEYWKRRVRREAGAAPLTTFAPVRVVPDHGAPATPSLEVMLAGGEQLTIREGISVDLLRTVITTLRAC
jgi:hypothetical protein